MKFLFTLQDFALAKSAYAYILKKNTNTVKRIFIFYNSVKLVFPFYNSAKLTILIKHAANL